MMQNYLFYFFSKKIYFYFADLIKVSIFAVPKVEGFCFSVFGFHINDRVL